LIIFVAGGVTYSEIRSAYQIGQALGKEVIIGKLTGIERKRELSRLVRFSRICFY
jgi:hypothetical protein